MENNPDSINLEWYHHMKCWKTFFDEGKIRRQQRKDPEEKGEGTRPKGPTSTEILRVEEEPPCHKETRMCFQRYVLFVGRFLVFIRQGRGTLIGIYTVILALYGHVDNIAVNIQPCYC